MSSIHVLVCVHSRPIVIDDRQPGETTRSRATVETASKPVKLEAKSCTRWGREKRVENEIDSPPDSLKSVSTVFFCVQNMTRETRKKKPHPRGGIKPEIEMKAPVVAIIRLRFWCEHFRFSNNLLVNTKNMNSDTGNGFLGSKPEHGRNAKQPNNKIFDFKFHEFF